MSGVEGVERKDYDEREAGIRNLAAMAGTGSKMLFMVIERPKDLQVIGERFRRLGRMLPEDVEYRVSWLTHDGTRCFQIMEAPSLESLMVWIQRWEDVVDFEIVPVLTSQQYWSSHAS